MPERIQKQRNHSDREQEQKDEIKVHEAEKDLGKTALKEELDDLLDEIDTVLEHNAEEFVKSYVQKGGE